MFEVMKKSRRGLLYIDKMSFNSYCQVCNKKLGKKNENLLKGPCSWTCQLRLNPESKKIVVYDKKTMRKKPIEEKLLFRVYSFSNYFEVYESFFNGQKSIGYMAKLYNKNLGVLYFNCESLHDVFDKIRLNMNLAEIEDSEEFTYQFNITKSTFRWIDRKGFIFGYVDLKKDEVVYEYTKSIERVLSLIMKLKKGEIGLKP